MKRKWLRKGGTLAARQRAQRRARPGGWQKDARFRYAVCGRRFARTYLGAEEMCWAYRLAVEHNVHPDNEIWYGAPTFKQAGQARDVEPLEAEHPRRPNTGPAEQHRMRDADERPATSCAWSVSTTPTRCAARVCGSSWGDEWDDAKPVILPEDGGMGGVLPQRWSPPPRAPGVRVDPRQHQPSTATASARAVAYHVARANQHVAAAALV